MENLLVSRKWGAICKAPAAQCDYGAYEFADSDALTHAGQLALPRRIAGIPVRPENCASADIAEGRVGPQQSPPGAEFD